MKILIVDDDPTIVAGLSAMLELHDFAPVGAEDCASAELRMTSEFFPLILADLRMRTEDEGLRLLDAVRRLSPRSRVASMTGYADADTERLVREHGAHVILLKPLFEDEVVAALREMLAVVESGAEVCVTDDELYTATVRSLHSICRRRYGFDRDDAEELVQEVWLLFLEKRNSVRAPGPWLSGAVANLCRQRIGSRIQDRARNTEIDDQFAVSYAHDATITIRQGLSRVDDRTRALCTRIGLERESYDEVSAALGIPLGSIGPLYQRAKEKLRRAIEH